MTASGPPDVETLLAHEGFVRGLARQLVTGDADVDDVVQQTFVAALEHPPRSQGGLRGWLATVVRNVVRQGYRAKGRRARRERVAARPEGVPSTADLLAREVARRTVVEAVVALDEPYRAAIVLRYLEGLPPRDVAARLGVPVETARTRVKRGLVLLRARLDERHRGDRRAWMAVVLPLAGPAAPPSSVGGAGARRGPVLVAAGLVIAVGGGAAWWAGTGSGAPAPAPTPRTTAWLAPTRGPDADQAPPVPAPAPSLAPAPRPTAWVAASRPAASLRGVVVGDGRRTVPGAEVRVAPEGPDGEVAAAAARTTRTDATGQFAFDGLAAGAWRVDVRAPDGRVATTSRAASAAGDATFVVVGPAAEAIVLGVHVEDAAGRPLAGAEVEVHLDDAPSASRRVVTGADGGATVEATATGPRVPGTLTARHRVGVALARFEVDRARDGVRPHVRLVVAAPATVEGRLTGPAGVDLDGTVVRVVPVGGGAGAATAVCVSVGDRFEGAGLPAGAYHLEVEPPAGTWLAADAAPVRVDVAAGARGSVTVPLAAAVRVHGRVRAASDGAALADATVTFMPVADGGPARARPRVARTDADGAWALDGATPGARYDVEVVPVGPFARTRAVVTATGAATDLAVGPGGAVDLVTDAGARVVLRREGDDPSAFEVVPPAGTGVAAVRVAQLAVGRWRAAVAAPEGAGLALGTFEVEAGRVAFLDTTVGADVVQRGRVTRDGAPVAGAVVAGVGPTLATTDADGGYVLRGRVGGRVYLDVVASGPEPDAVAIRRAAACMGLASAGSTVVVADFALGTGRWAVRVVDAAGRPLEGADVRPVGALDLDPPTVARRTDADGRASWSGVPLAAKAAFDVTTPDGVVARAEVPAATPDAMPTTVVVPAAGRARLRVVDAAGRPAVGAWIEVATREASASPRTVAQVVAPDGACDVVVPATGAEVRARRRDVASGAETVSPWVATADVVRDPSSGTLRLP